MSDFKKIILFVFSIIAVSCSEDGSTIIDTNAQAQDLIGTWNLTEESQNGTVSTEIIVGIPVKGNITSIGKDLDTQILFAESPTSFNASGKPIHRD